MQVDFYILQKNTQRSEHILCRLAEKAIIQKLKIHIHTGSLDQLTFLDEYMWTFRDGSFLAHDIINLDSHTDQLCPISISHQYPPQGKKDILFNLAKDIPEFYNSFTRIIEIIEDHTESKQQGRAHYQFYRQQNFDLNHHEI